MIDRTSKKVLKHIQSCPDYTFRVSKGFPARIPSDDFLSAVDFLEKEGFLTTFRGARGVLISASLTHQGKHQKEFNTITFWKYIWDKWIDIIALIISILAFIGAYRHEISELLQIIAKALIE